MKLHFCFILLICGSLLAADVPPASYFVANEGQWEAPFAFRYDGAGGSYFVTSEGLTIDLKQYKRSAVSSEPDRLPWERRESRPASVRGHVVKVKYLNANPTPEIKGEERLPHYSNYFLGSDSCTWRSFVGHYRRVMAKNVWAGVDIEYRIEPDGIESVYHLAAGVDPGVIQVQYDGLDAPLRTDNQDNLILQTSLGITREKAPFACQVWQGKREEVAVAYEIMSGNTIRLACSGYDRNIGMVIDPLLYGSFLGGGVDEEIEGIDILPDGRIVTSGSTYSTNFPTTPGAYQEHWNVVTNSFAGFVTELTANGDSMIFSTYLSGQRGYVCPYTISALSDGSIWTAGYIESYGVNPRWPLTPNALDTIAAGEYESFYTWLSADGSALIYSSYLGGNGDDFIIDIKFDTTGKLIMSGATESNDFPVTADAFASNREWSSDGFLCAFDPVDQRIDYSTFIPGDHDDAILRIWMRSLAEVWLSGRSSSSNFPVTDDALQPQNASGGGPSSTFDDGVFMRWDLAEHQLVYSSYLGGSDEDQIDDLFMLDSNRLIIVGRTRSIDFPVTSHAIDTIRSGGLDGFISLIQIPSDTMISSTFWGGSDTDYIQSICADNRGIVVIGCTRSPDFPVTFGAYDTVFNNNGQPGESYDLFISRLNADLSHLEYSTYLGGAGPDNLFTVCFISADTVWMGGETGSGDFPITAQAVQPQLHGAIDAFITKFAIPDTISTVTVRPTLLIPTDISLTVYPNPFNSTAQITFTLPVTQFVSLRLYDVLGREAATILYGMKTAGEHRVRLDGGALSSGVYFCSMEAGREMRTKKIVLMK